MIKSPLHVRCPTCGLVLDWAGAPARPFCSERCRLIDLGRWADETYSIEGEKSNPEEGDVHAFPANEK